MPGMAARIRANTDGKPTLAGRAPSLRRHAIRVPRTAQAVHGRSWFLDAGPLRHPSSGDSSTLVVPQNIKLVNRETALTLPYVSQTRS